MIFTHVFRLRKELALITSVAALLGGPCTARSQSAARTVQAATMEVGTETASLYPSLVRTSCINVSYKPFQGDDAAYHVAFALSKEDKKAKVPPMSAADLKKQFVVFLPLNMKELTKQLQVSPCTETDLFGEPDGESPYGERVTVEGVELNTDKNVAYLFINPRQWRGKDLLVGVRTEKEGKPFLLLNGVFVGVTPQAKTLKYPERPVGSYSIDAKQATGQVISRTIDITDPKNPKVLKEDKRDLWRFGLKASVSTVFTGPGSSFNDYINNDSLISQYERDPQSKLKFTYGIEHGLNGTRQPTGTSQRFLPRKFDTRGFLEAQLLGDQGLHNRSLLGSAGIALLLPKPSLGKSKIRFPIKSVEPEFPTLRLALQNGYDLRNARFSSKPRGLGELGWNTKFTVRGLRFPDSVLRLELLAKGWQFFEQRYAPATDANGNPAPSRRLSSMEKRFEGALLIPISSKPPASGPTTYLRIARVTGANDAKNFERSSAWEFSVALRD